MSPGRIWRQFARKELEPDRPPNCILDTRVVRRRRGRLPNVGQRDAGHGFHFFDLAVLVAEQNGGFPLGVESGDYPANLMLGYPDKGTYSCCHHNCYM
jgi:hypothetical protein